MKRFNLTPILFVPGLNPRLILMYGVLAVCSITALGQKGTCIVNNEFVHDCDTRGMDSLCTLKGQVLPCKTAPKSTCGDGGLLIIKLNRAGNYYERSGAYGEMGDYLNCRGLNIGFFGAARDVTWAFHADQTFWTLTGAYTEITKTFFGAISSKLAERNAAAFKEISETGQLLGLEGRYITSPEEIDKDLVMREQLFVDKALEQTGFHRNGIVFDINTRTKLILDSRPQGRLNSTMRAMAQVRENARFMNASAEYNYGFIFDRIAVGNILAKQHRK